MNLNLFRKFSRRQILMGTAVIVAIAVTIWYLLSGQAPLDKNLVQLQEPHSNVNNVQIKPTDSGGRQVTVKCENGSSYDVYLPPGESDSSAVRNNLCQKQ